MKPGGRPAQSVPLAAVHTDAIGWGPSGWVRVLDQTLLPGEVRYLELHTVDGMVEAIRALRVRGAPLIGIAAAMALAAEAEQRASVAGLTPAWLDAAAGRLASTRPTAVNLGWAVERMRRVGQGALARVELPARVAEHLHAEAQAIWDEDAAMCDGIGRAGVTVVPDGASVLTHCNTGVLATGGIGTAFGVIYTAHREGKGLDVIACETRPLGQGDRLTSWELERAGIPHRVIVDGAAGWLMAQGEVDLVITGADRIAANGDVANKIGTYGLAVLAQAHGIPFYVAAPRTTFDRSLASGDLIPIEQRAGAEIVGPLPGVSAYNPAFDVTPAEVVTGIITDKGVLRPPYAAAIKRLLD
ncbi:MAG: S-methyl-5-thioribose-1-phosphate isomerase [Gemmatimonadetes bacterium]|nr:S-methyl-5-thioribose-1-phosphate isomerase [Gemmatimonadota bacterium]